jgi:hypothetical protein
MAAHGFDGSEAGSGEWFIVWRQPAMMGGPSFRHPWLLHAVKLVCRAGYCAVHHLFLTLRYLPTIGTGFGVH